MVINRVILIVMDSVGVGHLPDAGRFNDHGTHTLLHVFQQAEKLQIPNLGALGMEKIVKIGCHRRKIAGCYHNGPLGDRRDCAEFCFSHLSQWVSRRYR